MIDLNMLAYKLSLLTTRLLCMADPGIDVNDISPLPSDDMSIDDIRRHDARELVEGIALTDDESEFLFDLELPPSLEPIPELTTLEPVAVKGGRSSSRSGESVSSCNCVGVTLDWKCQNLC